MNVEGDWDHLSLEIEYVNLLYDEISMSFSFSHVAWLDFPSFVPIISDLTTLRYYDT